MKKIFRYARLTISERLINHWTFTLTPAIYIERKDIMAMEKAYYIGIQWLVFDVYIVVTIKK